jgi:hypothetical protein
MVLRGDGTLRLRGFLRSFCFGLLGLRGRRSPIRILGYNGLGIPPIGIRVGSLKVRGIGHSITLKTSILKG